MLRWRELNGWGIKYEGTVKWAQYRIVGELSVGVHEPVRPLCCAAVGLDRNGDLVVAGGNRRAESDSKQNRRIADRW